MWVAHDDPDRVEKALAAAAHVDQVDQAAQVDVTSEQAVTCTATDDAVTSRCTSACRENACHSHPRRSAPAATCRTSRSNRLLRYRAADEPAAHHHHVAVACARLARTATAAAGPSSTNVRSCDPASRTTSGPPARHHDVRRPRVDVGAEAHAVAPACAGRRRRRRARAPSPPRPHLARRLQARPVGRAGDRRVQGLPRRPSRCPDRRAAR